MSDIGQSYDVIGKYLLHGQEGSQRGLLHLCDDKSVVGILYDSNNGFGVGTAKLALGRLSEGRLVLAKVAPLRVAQRPVYWIMKHDEARVRDARYEGVYTFGCGLDPFSIYIGLWLETMGDQWSLELERLAREIAPDHMTHKMIVGDAEWQSVSEESRRLGQTGEMTLRVRRNLF